VKNFIINIAIFIVICLLTISACSKKNEIKYISNFGYFKCDSVKLANSIVKEILFKRYIYKFNPVDTLRQNVFLLGSKYYIDSNKSYSALFHDKVIPIFTTRVDTLNLSTIVFRHIDFKNNLKDLNIEVDFFSLGQENTTTIFNYSVDTANCSWKLKDSSMFVY
jgi:hypothetical protein